MKYFVKDVYGNTVAQFDTYTFAFLFMKAYFDSYRIVPGDGLIIVNAENPDPVEEEKHYEEITNTIKARGRKAKKSDNNKNK